MLKEEKPITYKAEKMLIGDNEEGGGEGKKGLGQKRQKKRGGMGPTGGENQMERV